MNQKGHRWSAHEAEEILRRAIEIQGRDGSSGESTYSVDDIERMGSEVGVSSPAVRRAMAELQSERLALPSQTPDLLDRWFGPRWFVAHRSVPGPRRAVAEVVVKIMQDQLFRVQRNFGNTVVFVSASAWMEPLRRVLDIEQRYYLPLAEVVMVTVTDALHRPEWVDVRIEVGIPLHRQKRVHNTGVRVGLSMGGTAMAAALVGLNLPLTWVLAAGGLLASVWLARVQWSAYQRELLGLKTNMERLLDYLEHERIC